MRTVFFFISEGRVGFEPTVSLRYWINSPDFSASKATNPWYKGINSFPLSLKFCQHCYYVNMTKLLSFILIQKTFFSLNEKSNCYYFLLFVFFLSKIFVLPTGIEPAFTRMKIWCPTPNLDESSILKYLFFRYSTRYGNRTRVTRLKTWCPYP